MKAHCENKDFPSYSMSEIRPAVITTVTFAEKMLQARPASCAITLPDGGNWGLTSKFYFENGLLRSVLKAM